MPTITYKRKDFRPESLAVIDQANRIIAQYQQQDLRLTLRQLYYQFVSRDLLPNVQRSYDRLGRIISEARLAGLVDWDAIEDRTRHLEKNSHWDDPADIISACAQSYQIDKWQGQQYQVEVWIEKEALSGVLASVCPDLDVPFFACKGYVSTSEMWGCAQRLLGYVELSRTPVIIHLGDHDPSGIDMTRDIADRLETFMDAHGEDPPEVKRIALNFAQVQQYQPPPNPAKQTDARFDAYVQQFGVEESWELDALDPPTLVQLVRDAVTSYRNDAAWKEMVKHEKRDLKSLERTSDHWEEIDQWACAEFT